jgi:hypothetical protein
LLSSHEWDGESFFAIQEIRDPRRTNESRDAVTGGPMWEEQMAEEANDTMQQILIRFRGICAHVEVDDPKAETQNGNGKGKKRRTILVSHHGNQDTPIEHHTSYVEFYADDVRAFSPELRVVSYSKPGVDGRFARVDLTKGTIIRLKDTDPGDVEEAPSYRRDVPHFSEILKSFPEANRTIAPGLVGSINKLDTARAFAAFDMPAGTLYAGEPENTITRFPKNINFPPRRLARWAELQATVAAGPITLELSSTTGPTHAIEFTENLRMLTIGNEPERLILGVIENQAAHSHAGATPTQPSGHFALYYNLLDNPPLESDRAVPIPTLLGGAGCNNNNYP